MRAAAVRAAAMRFAALIGLASACAVALVPLSASAQPAAPTTGLLQARASIVSGCRVSGQESAVTGLDFGTLDFGSHPSLFGVPLTAQAQGPSGVIRLQCSGVVSATVTVGVGAAALGNQRRLSSGLHRIPYQLYADVNYNTPFIGTAPLAVLVPGGGGAAQVDLPIYGRIEPAPGGYPVGHYADQVQISVSW
ncbi:MAG: spore coat U domain-containing protein [Burkholderiaceae bacterium]